MTRMTESYFPYMNGQFVFKNAVVRFAEVINEGLQANNLEVSDIDMSYSTSSELENFSVHSEQIQIE